MAESEFSWKKLASFIGALVFVVLGIVTVANGIYLMTIGGGFEGAVNVICGIVCLACAVFLYKRYQKFSLEKRQ